MVNLTCRAKGCVKGTQMLPAVIAMKWWTCTLHTARWCTCWQHVLCYGCMPNSHAHAYIHLIDVFMRHIQYITIYYTFHKHTHTHIRNTHLNNKHRFSLIFIKQCGCIALVPFVILAQFDDHFFFALLLWMSKAMSAWYKSRRCLQAAVNRYASAAPARFGRRLVTVTTKSSELVQWTPTVAQVFV